MIEALGVFAIMLIIGVWISWREDHPKKAH
jgi:hypothetical protein